MALWIPVIIGGVALAYLAGEYSERCPKCDKWGARKEIDSAILDSKSGYETVTREDEIRDDEGNRIGTVEREEQVHVTTQTVRKHYRCKYCGYEWDEVEIEKHEG